nr:DUF2723 domain-containing protein [uncultured Flavobacterium sp.]
MLTINFKKWNIILGWFAFLISLITYTLTVEPTLSFWDAGEYIATSTKLQVGHPPGAPLYQMLGAVFSMFANGNENIALMVNMVAAVSSAFTILFMFWCTTNLLEKVVSSYTDLNKQAYISILGSAFIGSLAFTFSDTFWFSAVEAEVYATATFLISLLLWLGLRWVDDIDNPRGNKWFVLIGLVIGLSFGVHFMALLAIPSIGYLYYFKRYQTVTIKNFIIANIAIVSILLITFLFLLPYTLAFFGKTEIFAVNSIGLPFNSGTILAFLILVVAFVFGLRYTQQKNKIKANNIILCILFIFIGFSSWIMLPIRANTQIPINENKPSDAAEVLAYYNREQYGSRSLFYDTYFTTKFRSELDAKTPYVDGKPNYERDYETGKYIITDSKIGTEPNYSSTLKGFLPRMWSTDGSHPSNYMRFTKPLDFEIKPEFANEPEIKDMEMQIRRGLATGEFSISQYEMFLSHPDYSKYFDIKNPTFVDNMKFMFEYQFGYMYWRYLMWNFSGRQNDTQGNYDRDNGNWVTGIPFLDEIRIGSQENLTSDILNNKGRNHYYMIPFIIGLIGFIFHFRKDPKTFYVLLALFLFTSFALKIFLNERPFEPRERDYAVVASFMVFAMWIAFGVFAIYDGLRKYLTAKASLPLVLTACFLGAPVLMAKENWDDHDRSEKYTALAIAKAYLDSVGPNGIIFTIGDNDTFPLWYLQEVEGYRTDVRVVCTALLQADWYIDQMQVAAYDSKPLKIRFDHKQYAGNKLYYAVVSPIIEDRVDINSVMDYVASDKPETRYELSNGESIVRIPTNKLRVPINKETVIKNNIVSEKYYDQILPYIDLDIDNQALYRQRLIMLDIIANNNWERPIYFTSGSLSDEDFLWMKDHLQLSGLAYQLVPYKATNGPSNHPLYIGDIDTDKMYNTVLGWEWGNNGSSKIYHDPETRKNAFLYRINLTRLAEALIEEGKMQKAKKIVEIAMTNFPVEYFGNYTTVEPFVELYYALGEKQKGSDLVNQLAKKYDEQLLYYKSMKPVEQNDYGYEILESIDAYDRLISYAQNEDTPLANQHKAKLNTYMTYFSRFVQAMNQQRAEDQEDFEETEIIVSDTLKQ